MRALRIWIGLPTLILSSYLLFDPAHRLAVAWEHASAVGPYLLAVLAFINLGRALTSSASAYVGPALLASAALAFLLQPSIDFSRAPDVIIVAVVVIAALVIASALPEERTWTRVMWTGRARAPRELAGRLRAIAILGEVRLDMLSSRVDATTTLVAVTLGGRVVVNLPREWAVLTRPPGRLLLAVHEHGRRDQQQPKDRPDLEIRLLGVGGAVELKRV